MMPLMLIDRFLLVHSRLEELSVLRTLPVFVPLYVFVLNATQDEGASP
jgi:hypothetical protein